MVTITIDNQKIEVPEGTTVLNAARKGGIRIPTLCDHPHLTPHGGCRLCMVEIEGFRTLQSACTVPVSNNMVVRTTSAPIKTARKFVLTLIFSERNHFCPFCQVSGVDCELQNAAYGEEMTHWPLQPNWKHFTLDASHPYILIEHNRCILCRRCIRACSELVGINTLGVEERGAKTLLIADLNIPLGESTCVSCGTCVQVCPTGAMIDRRSSYRGQTNVVEHTLSVCVGCSLGCGIDVVTRDNQVVRIDGNWEAKVNAGVLCKVGRFFPLYDDRERILTPMLRENSTLQPATWEEALETVANKLKSSIGQSSSNVAALASTRLPVESLHLIKQLFSDALKSDMVTTLEEGTRTRLISEFAAQNGKPFEGSLDALHHSDCVLVFGADLVDHHEVAGFLTRRLLPYHATLIVVDSAENKMGTYTQSYLMPKAGTEKDFLFGLTAAIAKLGQNNSPFDKDPNSVLMAAAEKCAVSSDLLLEAAFRLSDAKNPVIIFDPHRLKDIDILKALVTLGENAGAVLINPKGGANSLAAAQYGLDRTFQLNGHQTTFVALADEIPTERIIRKLEKAPFLIVQASHASKLTAMADVVLPVVNWLEQEGHYLSMDGRLQFANSSQQVKGTVWSNSAVLRELAGKLGITLNGNWKDDLTLRPSPVEIAY